MEINPSEVTKILKEQIKKFGNKAEVTEVGQVLSVGDGIARIYGLRQCSSWRNGRIWQMGLKEWH